MQHEQDGDMGSAWLTTQAAGSGKFVLDERKPGEYTVLKANETYWKGQPLVKTVTIKNIEDPFEQAILLEKGEIDVAWDLQTEQVRRLETNFDIDTYSFPIAKVRFLAMNLAYEPLTKSEVRDAIRYAIDYESIVDFILPGTAVEAQTFIPKGVFGYNPSMPYTLDISRAKQLLSEAGYPNGFDLELACLQFPPWADVALQIKSDLAKIGINVELKQLSGPDFGKSYATRQYQLLLSGWGFDFPDPDDNAKVFAYCPDAGDDASIKTVAWRSRYVNEEISALVEQAAQELDTEKRKEMYTTITDTILDDGPYAILYFQLKQYGVRSEVRDLLGIPSAFTIGLPVLK
jgi:peptide/nickel transport system substrate-binding protein